MGGGGGGGGVGREGRIQTGEGRNSEGMRETGMKGGRNETDGLRGEEGCRQARGGGEGGIQRKNEGRREGDRDGGKEEVEQLRREDSREEEKEGGVCMTDFTLKNNRKCTNWEQQFRNWSCN